LVYSLKARFPQGLSKRIEKALQNNFEDASQIMRIWPHVSWENRGQRLVLTILFLLEELNLKLQENLVSEFYRLDPSLDVFVLELKKSVELINKTAMINLK
jgi:hypothetical protein